MTDTNERPAADGLHKTIDALALALLLNSALAQLSPRIREIISSFIISLGIGEASVAHSVLSRVTSIILYCIVFFLPALFIFKYAPGPEGKITYAPYLPKGFILTVISALGCVAISGRITSVIISAAERVGFGFAQSTRDVPDDCIGIILLFIGSAAVPAVTEEILFRKAILERLSPYGDRFAVIVTSAAFALMHTNPSQLLYAFTAGLFLGVVTLKTGSVVPAVIIHFSNNALSVIYLLVQKLAPTSVYTTVVSATDAALALAGLTVLFIYLKKSCKPKEEKNRAEGQKDVSPSPSYGTAIFRVFTLGYIAYTIFLMTRWIYII